jgi:hypothetical protein
MSHYKFQKILTIIKLLEECETAKQQLMSELLNVATDDILFKRRFRMLQQLVEFECQIINKIYHFKTNNVQDYEQCISEIQFELNYVTSRSA